MVHDGQVKVEEAAQLVRIERLIYQEWYPETFQDGHPWLIRTRAQDVWIGKVTPPPRRDNAEYHEAPWDIRNMPYKEEIIQKFIKEDLMESI